MIEEDLTPGMRVVLKPNLRHGQAPEHSATTHPETIRSVVRWLRERGISDIIIAESSGGLYNDEYMSRIYRTCGMTALEPEAQLNRDFTFRTINAPPDFQTAAFISSLLSRKLTIS